jgi:oleate hydratase
MNLERYPIQPKYQNMSSMKSKEPSIRDPLATRAWIIGGGIASLASAVYLLKEARLQGSNIHIFDRQPSVGGQMQSVGDSESGYNIQYASLPFFHGQCTEDLLSLVPTMDGSNKTIMDSIRDFESTETPQPGRKAKTRFVKYKNGVIERSDGYHLFIGSNNRLQLMKTLLESENAIGRNRIEDIFEKDFFTTEFWTLWSTT